MKTLAQTNKETPMTTELRRTPVRRRRFAPMMAAVLTLGMTISTGTSPAQAMTVYDPFNWIMNFMQEMKAGQEYLQTAQRWSETAQQYSKTIDNWMSKLQNWTQIIASP